MYNPTSGKYEPGWRPTEVIPQGMWEDVVNPRTGEHSLKIHTLKLVKEWCAFSDHEFDSFIPKDRKITCNKCGQEITFVVGYHELKDGHLSIRPQKD